MLQFLQFIARNFHCFCHVRRFIHEFPHKGRIILKTPEHYRNIRKFYWLCCKTEQTVPELNFSDLLLFSRHKLPGMFILRTTQKVQKFWTFVRGLGRVSAHRKDRKLTKKQSSPTVRDETANIVLPISKVTRALIVRLISSNLRYSICISHLTYNLFSECDYVIDGAHFHRGREKFVQNLWQQLTNFKVFQTPDFPEVKVSSSGFYSRANSESSHEHVQDVK